MREVFRKARAASPSIIFFVRAHPLSRWSFCQCLWNGTRQDEIDALGTARSDGDSHTDGILTSILNEMDGIEELVGVTVVAATNRPDVIVRPPFALLLSSSALADPDTVSTGLGAAPPRQDRPHPLRRPSVFRVSQGHLSAAPGQDGRRAGCQR